MRAGESAWSRSRGLLFPLLIVSSVLVILVPLPPVLMDLLISGNVTIAVLILLTTIYVARPLDFSVFPAILLGTTLIRLVLNVASTRLILTQGGTDSTAAAGGVIQAFGEFVTGDRIVVGLVIFVILIVIQFLVVTKGAGRISEVSARFFLDGLPGRQMSIDADLANKLITNTQAQARREELARQADFYGSMDGASKFVRGDAIAGIVITLINIMGGLYVGVIEHDMKVLDAAAVFTKLTIGDGLVSQLPSFLIAIAAGLIVTRSSQRSDLPSDVVTQLIRHPQALFLAAGFLVAMSFTGLPALPVLALAVACSIVGYSVMKNPIEDSDSATAGSVETSAATKSDPTEDAELPESPQDRLAIELMAIELGSGAVSLADPNVGGDLLDRISQVRHQLAGELGIILPQIHVRDNSWLGLNDYVIRLRGSEVARGEIWATHRFAINRGSARGELPGIRSTDPISGSPAFWIEPTVAKRAESQGFFVLESTSLLVQHFSEICRTQADELLTRQHVHELIGALRDRAPLLVEECESSGMRISIVHQVLKNLLIERVPIRDLESILQTIIDQPVLSQGVRDGKITQPVSNHGPSIVQESDNPRQVGMKLVNDLTERVRSSLSRTISQKLRDYKRRIHLVTLSASLEDELLANIVDGRLVMNSAQTAAVTEAIETELRNLTSIGLPPILITNASELRISLFRICQRAIPRLSVVKATEISMDTDLITRGHVGVEQLVGTRI
jgi:flagellar biosynthesis protein FlhA